MPMMAVPVTVHVAENPSTNEHWSINIERGEESASRIPWAITSVSIAFWAMILLGIAIWVGKKVRSRKKSQDEESKPRELTSA